MIYKFRSWSELNRVILREKDAVRARAWYSLRVLDKERKGWVGNSDVQKGLEGLLEIGYRRVSDILEKEEGHWWKGNGYKIEIVGQAAIARSFGCKLGFAVEIPIQGLTSLELFKATLFSTWFARDTWRYVDKTLSPKGGKTISLASLCELFGHSRSTIQRWVKTANIQCETQFQYVKCIDENVYVPEHVIEHGLAFAVDIDHDGKTEIGWQLPSRYSSPTLSAEKKRWQNRGLEGPSSGTWAASKRLFYDNASAFANSGSHNESGQGTYLYQPKIKKGKRWYVQIVS